VRDELFKVIKELEGFDDPSRVREAAMLQDELREAQAMVARIREAAAAQTVAKHGTLVGAELADTSVHALRALADGWYR
jgi:hypothetical protein